MKVKLRPSIIWLVLPLFFAINFQISNASAQGSLTPPGSPEPTMKSLDQIEPRIPISTTPFIITQSGSYYLTTNLVTSGAGISIRADNVTLDLNGFTISSTATTPTASAIGITTGSGITIFNGHIQSGTTNDGTGVYSGTGFVNGILVSGKQLGNLNILVSWVSIVGCSGVGIQLGNVDNVTGGIGSSGNASTGSTVVESCMVQTVGGTGIQAFTVKNSSAIDCGSTAIIGDQVSDCRGQCSGDDDGIDARNIAVNCSGTSSGDGDGINAKNLAQNCNGQSSGDDGIHAFTAQNCYGVGTNDGSGIIVAWNAQNCYGISHGDGDGLDAATAQNCYGESDGAGDGIYANQTAIGCFGYSLSGTGMTAFIADSCTGNSLSLTHSVNSY